MTKTNGGYVAGKAKTQSRIIGGPYWTRRRARKLERCVQAAIGAGGGYSDRADANSYIACGLVVPPWAAGVRVERMGDRHFSPILGHVTWALVATSDGGH